VPPSGFREISHTAQGASYAVPDSSYSIVMVVAERVWTIVNIPATATTPKYAQIVSPAESPKAFPVSGSSSIEISASATSIKVESGGTILGTIDAPKLMYLYSFVPTGT
jgi:hypothetical protein